MGVTGTDLRIIESEEGAALSIALRVKLLIPELLNALMSLTEKQKNQEEAQGHASTDATAQPAPTPPEDSAKDEPSPTNTGGEDQYPQPTPSTWDTDLAELQPTRDEQYSGRWWSSSNGWKLLDEEALRSVKIKRLQNQKLLLIKKAPTPETSDQAAQKAEEALAAAKKMFVRPSESHSLCDDHPPLEASPPSMQQPLAESESKTKGSETHANKAEASPPLMPSPLAASKSKGSETQANKAGARTDVPQMPSGPPPAPSDQKDCKSKGSETHANKAGASPPSIQSPLAASKSKGSQTQANKAGAKTDVPPMPSGPPRAPVEQKDCKHQ